MSSTAYLIVAESVPYEELRSFMLGRGGEEVRATAKDVYKFFVPLKEGYVIICAEPNYVPKIFDEYDQNEWSLITKKLGAVAKMLLEIDVSGDADPSEFYRMAFDFCKNWSSVLQDVGEDILTCEEIRERGNLG